MGAGVAVGEAEDVLHVGAVPLEDGLVVVADDGERGAEVGEGADHLLLQLVGVLVLVDDDAADARGEALPGVDVAAEDVEAALQLGGEVVERRAS